METSDAIELSGLCDIERSQALARFEIIRPFLEDGVPLTRLALEQQIVLRTARRWVERYQTGHMSGADNNVEKLTGLRSMTVGEFARAHLDVLNANKVSQ